MIRRGKEDDISFLIDRMRPRSLDAMLKCIDDKTATAGGRLYRVVSIVSSAAIRSIRLALQELNRYKNIRSARRSCRAKLVPKSFMRIASATRMLSHVHGGYLLTCMLTCMCAYCQMTSAKSVQVTSVTGP